MLEINHVSKKYGAKEALRDVSRLCRRISE